MEGFPALGVWFYVQKKVWLFAEGELRNHDADPRQALQTHLLVRFQ